MRNPSNNRLAEIERLVRYQWRASAALLAFLFVWLVVRRETVFDVLPSGQLDDPMMSTGFLTTFFGVSLSLILERRFRAMNASLKRQKILSLRKTAYEAVEYVLERSALWVRLIAAVSIGLVMLVGYANYYGDFDQPDVLEFTVASALLGVVVGARLGTIAAYGLYPGLLFRKKVGLDLVPGHRDRSGGLGKFGAYYVLQGALVAIILVWLIAWLLLIELTCPTDPCYRSPYIYGGWREHFYVLVIIASAFLFIGSILPIWRLSQLMKNGRTALGPLSRHLEQQIAETGNDAGEPDAQSTLARLEKRRLLTEQLQRIYDLPVLPLGGTSRKLFTLTNSLPIVGLVLDVTLGGKSQLADLLGAMLSVFAKGQGL